MSALRWLLTHAHRSVIRLLERRRIRFVCVSVLVMSLALLAISFATADRGQTVFGPFLGGDYIGFYSAARLLNTAPPARLYDFALQDEIYHDVQPDDPGRLPYLHPPFVALAFSPLARLPYTWSFGVWLLLSGGLYLVGLMLTLRALPSLPGTDRPLILLLALSFEPFLMECWIGGQLSACGFFFLALAYYWLERGRPTAAGAALGLCLYKPTLLVLLLPMLVVGRYWRVLAGFTLTGVALTALSFATLGWQACLEYVWLLLGFARTTTSRDAAVLSAWKYVDLNSFLRLLFGGPSPVVWILMLLILAVPLGSLAAAWWRSRDEGAYRRLIWASTLTWTLVANLYVGAYDSILVVLAALWAAAVLRQPGKGNEPFSSSAFPGLLLLLYVAPWFSQHLARAVGVQPYSLVLLTFAIYLLILARQIGARAGSTPRREPGDVPSGWAADEGCPVGVERAS